MKKILIKSLWILILFSNAAFALLAPLTNEERTEKATLIATGEITASDMNIQTLSDGINAVYIVNMKVDTVEKGQGVAKGDRVIFQYWKADKRPNGWVGDFGQSQTLKVGDHVKVYMKLNEKADMYTLLNPNGFDLQIKH
jgi:hypothetical protein